MLCWHTGGSILVIAVHRLVISCLCWNSVGPGAVLGLWNMPANMSKSALTSSSTRLPWKHKFCARKFGPVSTKDILPGSKCRHTWGCVVHVFMLCAAKENSCGHNFWWMNSKFSKKNSSRLLFYLFRTSISCCDQLYCAEFLRHYSSRPHREPL